MSWHPNEIASLLTVARNDIGRDPLGDGWSEDGRIADPTYPSIVGPILIEFDSDLDPGGDGFTGLGGRFPFGLFQGR